MGYARAGFDVVGVDIAEQPRYPFAFYQHDALHALEWLIADGELWGMRFDAIHASPPCQAHTTMSNRWRGAGGLADEHFNLIPETRELLIQTGLPYVIENVPGARKELRSPVVLNGPAVGLRRILRPRLFECNFPILVPQPRASVDPIGVYGKAHDGRLLFKRVNGSEQRAAVSLEEAREVMGIDWMDWRELTEAIPPAYTQHVGEYLMREVLGRGCCNEWPECSHVLAWYEKSLSRDTVTTEPDFWRPDGRCPEC